VSFPYADPAYAYPGPALRKAWARLHRGDCEAFPASEPVRDLWRAYHAGDYGRAIEGGAALGPKGYKAAGKAAAIYTSYVEPSEARKLAILRAAMERAEALQDEAPEDPNAFYFYALAAGRYSQDISLGKALAQGLGGKVRDALLTTLELQPKHADAHIALGAWHAGVEHFQKAIKLNPASAIARIEYAKHLVLLFGDAREKDAAKLYAQAAKCRPADAMERLDVEGARAALA
jgi:tetratricopeptide (TPR) repeat protein